MARMRVGIIGAMESEVSYLTAQLVCPRERHIMGIAYVAGMLADVDCVVVRCGIGKVNAAACTQALIDEFNVTHVINTGVAGALDARIHVGDLVISADAVEHDLDVTPLGYAPGEHPDLHASSFKADAFLHDSLVSSAREAAHDVQVFEGRVCSGDQFIGTAAAKERIIATFGGMCCEMEGASIAHVCFMNEVPFVVVRAISDTADESGSVNYAEFEQAAAEHCAKTVLAALHRLAESA